MDGGLVPTLLFFARILKRQAVQTAEALGCSASVRLIAFTLIKIVYIMPHSVRWRSDPDS